MKKKTKFDAPFTTPLRMSWVLRAALGMRKTEATRPEIIKSLWSYIKRNGLRSVANPRTILFDEALQTVFGVPQANMFELTKLVSAHVGTSNTIDRRLKLAKLIDKSEQRTAKLRQKMLDL